MSLRSSERGLKFETTRITSARNWSLRSSERGLKLQGICGIKKEPEVAPFVGAWIEMSALCRVERPYPGRSVRRSVD